MAFAELEQLGLVPRTYASGTLALAYSEGPANGPKLVLVHGLTGRRDSFIRVLPTLVERFQVFALDLRGHGNSGHQPSKYALRDYAGDLAAFLEHVVGRGAVIWGQSLGASASILMLSEQPELACGVILEEPALTRTPPNSMGSTFEFWLSLADSKPSLAEFQRALAAHGGLSHLQVTYKAETLFALDPTVLRCALAGEVTALDLIPPFLSLKLPTLLLQGDPKAGGIIPTSLLESLKPLPANMEHRALLGIGHKPHDQAPQETLGLVLAWHENHFA